MRNRDVAKSNVVLLKERRKKLAATAEFIMSVDTFTSKELAAHFDITVNTALSRVEELKKIGFEFFQVHRGRNSGVRLRLVDCSKWDNTISSTAKRKEEPLFTYVIKANFVSPNIPDLWKLALGIKSD
jgi:hypothetical protein